MIAYALKGHAIKRRIFKCRWHPLISRENGIFWFVSIHSCVCKTGVTIPGCRCMGGHSLLTLHALPTPGRNDKIQGIQVITFGDYLAAGTAEKFSVLTTNRLRRSTTLELLSGQLRFFLPLDGPLTWIVEFHLPESASYEAPVFRLLSFSGLELDIFVSGYLKCMSRKYCRGSRNLFHYYP